MSKSYPLLRMAEWLTKNEVRLFFGVNGSITVVKMKLPWVRSAKNVRVVDEGMGLALGDGRDVSALALWEMPGRVIRFRKPPARRRATSRAARAS